MTHYESSVVGTSGALVGCLLSDVVYTVNCAATKGKGKVNCVCSCVSTVGIASYSSQTKMSLPPMLL